jgi:CubicO group peptidase (beta-lactamase class C family)
MANNINFTGPLHCRRACLLLALIFVGPAAAQSDPATYYYPPTTPGDDTWQTVSAASLGWDEDALADAVAYAADQDSTAMIVLYKGSIVSESYWQGWNLHTTGIIHSAHKTISAALFGVMQEQGLAHRDDFVTSYLGVDWAGTQVSAAQGAAIRIRHLQTHTSGLGEQLFQGKLTYLGAPDTRWEYNTLAYRKMNEIIQALSPQGDYHDYATANLYDPIGMNDAGDDGTHSSLQSARDMARFGLMMLANGSWDGVDIIEDKSYVDLMRSTSQPFNEAYGALTWLNGKSSYLAPKDATVHPGALFPDAPADLYAALGRDDKKIYVVPSLDLVVVRHGPVAPDGGGFAGSAFDNELWERLCLAMPCNGSGHTGYRTAAANASDSGGDGNGFESSPANAYADGGGAAGNIDGAADRHRYYNYDIAIPAGHTITGIEVRTDWWLDSSIGTSFLRVELSWDGGTTWTAQKLDTQETTVEHTGILGGPADLWGRVWTEAELSNANFRVRVVSSSNAAGRDFFLDWIAVRVHYGD